MAAERIATVAIVGRPNVGKSTLFNRLVGRRISITLDTPGVTRDPIVEDVVWLGRALKVVDTGGLGGEADIALADQVHEHTVASVRDADLAVVVFDARAGVNPLDRETVALLERLDIPVLYVANKADTPAAESLAVDFCQLGIDVPFPVSAEHAVGLSALREKIVECLGGAVDPVDLEPAFEEPDADTESGEDGEGEGEGEGEQSVAVPGRPVRVAIVGRPNVGKSSFLNLVAGEALSLVDSTPGTTRDVVDTLVERDGRRYLLLDTAGMRRPSKIDEQIERISVNRALDAVRRAAVVVLMIEPVEGLTDQDARIARMAWDEGRALVIMMNKMDLAGRGQSHASLAAETYRRVPTLSVVPMGFMSVTENRGVEGCFGVIDDVQRAHSLQVQTAELNRILAASVERREPPVISRGRIKFFYIAQTATRPPTFQLFVNRETVPTDYTRFLERCFRESLPLAGSPLRLRYRRRPSH